MKLASLAESRLGKVLYEFRREFVWVGVFSLIANVLMLTPTIYMLQVYDRVLKSQNELTLAVVTVIMIALFAVMAVAELLRSRLLVRAGVRLDESLNSLVFHSSFRQFLTQGKNTTVTTFTDMTNIRQFLTGQGIIAFFDIPWSPVYILVSFLLHPLLGSVTFVFAAVQAVLAWRGHVTTSPGIAVSSDKAVAASSYIQSKLRNIEAVHAMGMAANLRPRWVERQEEAVASAGVSQDEQQRQQSISKFFRYCMQSLTLGAGALLVLDGQLSVGGMIAGNVLMARALAPLDMVVTTWKQFVQAREGYDRLEGLLDEFDVREEGHAADEVQGGVVAEALSASAAGGSVQILHDLSTRFSPGEVAVMVGPSGSGKSTFARCLLGIWPETSGKVLVDGVDVKEWDRRVLGPAVGYLPQDVELFDGSLAENIARFTEVDSEKVIAAAAKTGIHEMILHLPKGYDSRIGEAGSALSGGQRQRVALARALYDDPALVVLDEPNANLDEAGEKALAEVVRDLAANRKTVVLITHRPGILAVADRLLVMKEGRLVEDGPRDEVIERLKDRNQASGSEPAPPKALN